MLQDLDERLCEFGDMEQRRNAKTGSTRRDATSEDEND